MAKLKRLKKVESRTISSCDFEGSIADAIRYLSEFPANAQIIRRFWGEDIEYEIMWTREETDEEFAKRQLQWDRAAPKREAKAAREALRKAKEALKKEADERKLCEKLAKKYGAA